MITKEEFIKKYYENFDKEMSRFFSKEWERKFKQHCANDIFRKIVGGIETANLNMLYCLSKEEVESLPNEFFEEKLRELKQNYDFLVFDVVRKPTIFGEAVAVVWDFKDE